MEKGVFPSPDFSTCKGFCPPQEHESFKESGVQSAPPEVVAEDSTLAPVSQRTRVGVARHRAPHFPGSEISRHVTIRDEFGRPGTRQPTTPLKEKRDGVRQSAWGDQPDPFCLLIDTTVYRVASVCMEAGTTTAVVAAVGLDSRRIAESGGHSPFASWAPCMAMKQMPSRSVRVTLPGWGFRPSRGGVRHCVHRARGGKRDEVTGAGHPLVRE